METLYRTQNNNHEFVVTRGDYKLFMDGKEVGYIEKDYCINRYGHPKKSSPLYRAYDVENGTYCMDYTLKETLAVFAVWYLNCRNPQPKRKKPAIKKPSLDKYYNETQKLRVKYVESVKEYIKEAFVRQSEYVLSEEQIEDSQECGECFCVSVPLRHETVTVNITKVVFKDGQYYVDGAECDSEYSQEWHSDVWCNTSLSDLEGIMEFIKYWCTLNNK